MLMSGRFALNMMFDGPGRTFEGLFRRPMGELLDDVFRFLLPPQRSMYGECLFKKKLRENRSI